MKLVDALRGLPERRLEAYRKLAGRQASPPELAAALARPERVREALARLSPEAMTALRVLWFQGPSANRWDVQHVFLRLQPRASLEQAISVLSDQALVLPPLTSGQVQIPEEIVPVLHTIAYNEWIGESRHLLPEGWQPPSVLTVDPVGVVTEFARLLAAIRAGVRPRQQDSIPYMADQRRLLAALDPHLRSGAPPSQPWPAFWGGYIPGLGLPFACAMAYGLLESRDGMWRESARAARWVRLEPGAQWAGLLQVWAMLVLPKRTPPLGQTVWMALQEGRWYQPTLLTAFLGQYQVSSDQNVAYVHNLLVHLGVAVGALECAPVGDGWAVRLLPDAVAALNWLDTPQLPLPDFPALEETPVVQGTFEILAGPRVPTRAVWLLESWAERVSLDRFATYRLTRRAATDAARRGDDLAELLEELGRSPGGVPQNVLFTLREWAGSVSRARALVGLVLRLDDSAAVERAAAALQRCERLGPKAWLVPTDAVSSVWRGLVAAGCDVDGDAAQWRERLKGAEAVAQGLSPPPPSLPWPGHPQLSIPGLD